MLWDKLFGEKKVERGVGSEGHNSTKRCGLRWNGGRGYYMVYVCVYRTAHRPATATDDGILVMGVSRQSGERIR